MNYDYYQLVSLQQATNDKLDTIIENQNNCSILIGCELLCLCVILLLSIIKV